MLVTPRLLAALALLAVPAWAEIPARPVAAQPLRGQPPPTRIDVRANGESISEVLDHIARQTGMKVTYEGGAPRLRIHRQVAGVTPAQAVVGVLEGQGLSYFMELDRTSTQVQTLLIVNGTGARARASASSRRTVAAPRPDEPEEAEEEVEAEEAPEEPVQQGPRQFRNSEALNQVEPEREPAPPPGAAAEEPAAPAVPAPNLGGVPGAFRNYAPPPVPPPAEEAPAPSARPRRRPPGDGVQ